MLYLVNAVAMGFIASIWSKTGWLNILIAMVFVALMVINAVGSYPVASQLIKF